MKRTINMLLAMGMVVGILSGCGGDAVTQEAAELGENFHPFQLVISYEDAFYGKGVLSYLTTVWEYRGGANGKGPSEWIMKRFLGLCAI